MVKITPTGGGNGFSFKKILETAGEKPVEKNKDSVSTQNDVAELQSLLQKGAPSFKIVLTALKNNPLFQLLSHHRQKEMVTQLTNQVQEDPTLKLG